MSAVQIRFGGYQPPSSVHNRAAKVFGRALAARLESRVDFCLDGNILASGHRAADLLSMIETGTLTMGYFSTSYLADRVAEFGLLDLPFMLLDRSRAYEVLDGELGQLLAERLRLCSGFRVLDFWDNGFRHLSNARRPIRTPADCQGLRIRTLFSDLHTQVFTLLGFEPVALDVKDLVAGVQSGAIEAQENPLTNIYHFGIHAYHRYITLSGHFFGAAVLLCHQASYAAWPADIQRAVIASAAEATAAQRAFAVAEDDAVLSQLQPPQNQVVRLTESERTRFVDAVAPLVEAQRRAFGSRLFSYLEP